MGEAGGGGVTALRLVYSSFSTNSTHTSGHSTRTSANSEGGRADGSRAGDSREGGEADSFPSSPPPMPSPPPLAPSYLVLSAPYLELNASDLHGSAEAAEAAEASGRRLQECSGQGLLVEINETWAKSTEDTWHNQNGT